MKTFAELQDATAIEQRAAAWITDPRRVAALLAPLTDALRADPWFEPPFKASRDRLRTGVVLLDCAAVTISATVTRAADLNQLAAPATVVLPGRVTLTCYVRGGEARMRRWRAEAAGRAFSAATAAPAREITPLTLKDGTLIRQDGRTTGHLLTDAKRDIVTLTATIKPDADPLMREYSVTDGAFVRAACADDTASRIEMLLTFLRVSGRTDATTLFDNASHHPAFHLRWAAMREWLMLDGRSARSRLAEMCADDANAEIRAAAAATLPILDQRLEPSCPA
ncbi:hypothetical protein [Sphingomonas sp.]|uniref:hypothetical protein n=1 Tax=Sphingomonas sp. TaxID=28214 RepID=UPI002ED91C9F